MTVMLLTVTGPDNPFLSFFFNDTATTEIYTLSLHDALPIFIGNIDLERQPVGEADALDLEIPPQNRHFIFERDLLLAGVIERDRKSTRLNSSHSQISYAVFCLKKKTSPKHALQPHLQSLTLF